MIVRALEIAFLTFILCRSSVHVYYDEEDISSSIIFKEHGEDHLLIADIAQGSSIGLSYIKNFISPQEAERFISFCEDRQGFSKSPQRDIKESSTTGSSSTTGNFTFASKQGLTLEHKGRTSSSCPLIWPLMYLPRMDEARARGMTASQEKEVYFAYDMAMRVAKLFECNVARIEPLQMVKYEHGQYYRRHHDDGRYYNISTEHRSHTLLLFASSVPLADGGGHTAFPELKLRVLPTVGDAIVWENVDAAGLVLTEAVHEAATIYTEGVTKYAVNVWISEENMAPFYEGFDESIWVDTRRVQQKDELR